MLRRRRCSRAGWLAVALLLAACSRFDDSTTQPTTTEPTSAAQPTTTAAPPTTTTTAAPTTTEPPVVLASGPSAGCDQPRPATLPTTITTADGVQRTFRVSLPRVYDQAVPAPLVFDFHGLGSEGFQEALVSGVDLAADRAGFIAVVPDGAENELLGTRLWNLSTGDQRGALSGLAVDDVAFVVELLDSLEAQLCVDTGRVFSMGLSNGGFFSTVLACDLADRFAAVATVAGITHPDTCEPVRPVPVLNFHGTGDTVVPFDGGESILTQGGGMIAGLDEEQLAKFGDELFQPIENEVAQWAATDGCSPEPEVIAVSDAVEQRVFEGCDADVEFYVVEGGGHTWPGSLVMAFITSLGPTTLDISATDLAFAWFADHPMPASS